MPKSAPLDFATLESKRACEERYTFQDLFGDSAEVTVEKAREVADKFQDWGWPVRNLLPAEYQQTYNKFVELQQDKLRIKMQAALLERDYTASGRKRTFVSERMRQRYMDRIAKVERETLEVRATTWAKLYIDYMNNAKIRQLNKLKGEFTKSLTELMTKVYNLTDDMHRLENELGDEFYNVSQKVRRETEARRQEQRREQRLRRNNRRRTLNSPSQEELDRLGIMPDCTCENCARIRRDNGLPMAQGYRQSLEDFGVVHDDRDPFDY